MEKNQKILHKLAEVQKSVPSYMKKGGFNKAFNYSYTSEKQLKEVFQPLFKEAGVIFKVDVIDQKVEPGDGKMRLTLVTMQYHFIDSESGESIEGTFCSQGSDSGDKGIFKAITGAIKYILTSTFLIPTGDDPEKDEVASKPASLPKADPLRSGLLQEATGLLKKVKDVDESSYKELCAIKHPSNDELRAMIVSMKTIMKERVPVAT